MQAVKASVIAGAVPGILAPLLWPAVIYLDQGTFPNWEIYPVFVIAFFALIVGVSSCIVLGIPVLFCLNKLWMNRPWIAAMLGFALAITTFGLLGPAHDVASLVRSWPFYTFLGMLGAVSGFTASYVYGMKSPSQEF